MILVEPDRPERRCELDVRKRRHESPLAAREVTVDRRQRLQGRSCRIVVEDVEVAALQRGSSGERRAEAAACRPSKPRATRRAAPSDEAALSARRAAARPPRSEERARGSPCCEMFPRRPRIRRRERQDRRRYGREEEAVHTRRGIRAPITCGVVLRAGGHPDPLRRWSHRASRTRRRNRQPVSS